MNVSLPRRIAGKDGFTFIEVMVVLALLAVVASLASPSMDGYLNRTEVNSATSQMVGDIEFTRMLAVETGQGAAFEIENATTYVIARPEPSGDTARTVVDLSQVYPGLMLERADGQSFPLVLGFDSRGLLRDANVAGVLEVRHGEQAGSLRILASGRAFREN